MNRLIACAALGFGLVTGVVACGDDDDSTPGGSSGTTSGGSTSGGSTSGGKGGGGSSAGGSSAGEGGGIAGETSGGSSAGGTSSGGSGNLGGGTSGGEGPVGGDNAGGSAGAGGDGAGGAPAEGPIQVADDEWLSYFCHAISDEELGCSGSPEWILCYSRYSSYLSNGGDLDPLCLGDDPEKDDPETEAVEGLEDTVALIAALDTLAAECPDPEADQFSCDLAGTPSSNDQECQSAYTALLGAYATCTTPPP